MSIFSGIGAIFTSASADRNRKRQLQELKKNQALWDALQTPSIENLQMVVQQEISQGRLTPELGSAILADPSAMAEVGANPELVRAQEASLGALQNIARQGGMDIQSRANLARIQDQLGQQERGQREALLSQQQRQGTLGSGQGLAAQLQAQQASADRAAQAGFQQAASADQRALQALIQSGQMAGQMRTQQVGEEERRAAAADRINRFNTQHRQQLQAANRNTINAANRYNMDLNVGRERRNVDRRQEGAKQHAGAYKDKFLIDRSKVAGQTGSNTAIADLRGQKAGRMEQATGQLLEDAGEGLDKIAKAGAGGLAEGGVIPGQNYVGDRVDAQLNSGEMVLNAKQQQNLLDLLSGKTKNINPEVPIVEDTVVENPLDVLANMNKQNMADGGLVSPEDKDYYIPGMTPNNPTANTQVPWDKYSTQPQAGMGATEVPTEVPPVVNTQARMAPIPTPSQPTEQTPEKRDLIETLLGLDSGRTAGQKVAGGAGGLFKTLSTIADPAGAAKRGEAKAQRDLQAEMQQKGIDERELKFEKEQAAEQERYEREQAEKLAAEEEAKKPMTYEKWVKESKMGGEEKRSIGLAVSAAEGFFAAEKKILDSKGRADLGRQMAPGFATELKTSLDQAASALVRNESGAAVPPKEMDQYLAMLPTKNDILTGHSDIINYKMQQFYNRIRNKFAVYPLTFKELLRGSTAKEGRDINKVVHKKSVYHQDYDATKAPQGLSKEEQAELDELNKQDKADRDKLKGMK